MWLLFNCRRVYVVRLGQQAASCNSVDSFSTTQNICWTEKCNCDSGIPQENFPSIQFQSYISRGYHVRRRHSSESQGLGPRNRSLYPSPGLVTHGPRNPALLQAFNSCSLRAGGYGQSTYHCPRLAYLLQKMECLTLIIDSSY